MPNDLNLLKSEVRSLNEQFKQISIDFESKDSQKNFWEIANEQQEARIQLFNSMMLKWNDVKKNYEEYQEKLSMLNDLKTAVDLQQNVNLESLQFICSKKETELSSLDQDLVNKNNNLIKLKNKNNLITHSQSISEDIKNFESVIRKIEDIKNQVKKEAELIDSLMKKWTETYFPIEKQQKNTLLKIISDFINKFEKKIDDTKPMLEPHIQLINEKMNEIKSSLNSWEEKYLNYSCFQNSLNSQIANAKNLIAYQEELKNKAKINVESYKKII